MKLRELQKKDVPFIYEWMQDPQINRFFQFDPTTITTKTITAFVEASRQTGENLHLACVDESDEYLGTISLKNIDRKNQTAEYAVSMRAKAQGSGAALYATQEILRKAFMEMSLYRVYLNVYADNTRAIRFYKKIGFVYEGEFRQHILAGGERKSLQWYAVLKPEWRNPIE